MNIAIARPPNWSEIKQAFDLKNDQVLFFTYGDTLYNPKDVALERHLIVHEETHAKQQEHSEDIAAIWWKRYLMDKEFRLSQEVEAYGNQYRFICTYEKDRNRRAQYLAKLAEHLSSPMYGRIIGYPQALALIKKVL